MTRELVLRRESEIVPAIIERSGGNARFAYDEFIKAAINNEHTRRAYTRIVGRLLSWCEANGIELPQLTPGPAGEYLSSVEGSAPTKNQALAALRHFFDAMVTRHVVPLNSFASVRGVKYSVTEGKTPELGIEQARALFRSIDVSNVVGLRDRAVLSVLAYTGARVNAVAKLHLSDYRNLGEQRTLRFREKGGKDREIPVRHDLQGWINEYIAGRQHRRGYAQRTPLPRGRGEAKAAHATRLQRRIPSGR